jgi:hypothetical protein
VHPICTLFAPKMHPDAAAQMLRAPCLHPECNPAWAGLHPICTQNATTTAKPGSQHEAFGSKALVVEHKGLSDFVLWFWFLTY